jgi:hypothetical protein
MQAFSHTFNLYGTLFMFTLLRLIQTKLAKVWTFLNARITKCRHNFFGGTFSSVHASHTGPKTFHEEDKGPHQS